MSKKTDFPFGANAPDLFAQSNAERLAAAGYELFPSPFSGADYWKTPDGRERLTTEEALARLDGRER